jgi:hypothetical protein
MLKRFLMLYFPMLMGAVRFADEAEGGGDAGDAGAGEGVVDHGSSQSREIPADGGRQKAAAGADSKPWYESAGVDPAVLTDKDREYKTLTDYVKGTQSARQLAASKGIPIPGKDATPEQKAAFQAEVLKHFPDLPMAPDSADKYEIPMFKDSGLPEDRQKEITKAFHSAGLSNKAAASVMDIYADQVAKDMAFAQTQVAEQAKATEAELKTLWGAEYADRTAGIERIAGKYPELMDAAKQVGFDSRKDFRLMMDEVARSIAEDHSGHGGAGDGAGLDSQIATMRADIKKTENSLERGKMTEQLAKLYERRANSRK